jgi:hypothetical protein
MSDADISQTDQDVIAGIIADLVKMLRDDHSGWAAWFNGNSPYEFAIDAIRDRLQERFGLRADIETNASGGEIKVCLLPAPDNSIEARLRRLEEKMATPLPAAATTDDYFGVCPICHKCDGYANAGRSHRCYCKEHKTSWCIGANLFSDWREQTEEEQRQIWDEIGLNNFKNVEPYFHPRSTSEIDSTESIKRVDVPW